MRTGELYECVESPFSYSRSWGYTPSRILLYDGWLRHRLLNELFRSLKNSAFHRLSRSVNLEYYAFLVFSNLSNRNDSSYIIYLISPYFPAIFLHSSRISSLNLAGFITVTESPKPIAQEKTICFWLELNFRRTVPSSC